MRRKLFEEMWSNEKSWMVYILICQDGTFYCGITNNFKRRLEQHNGIKPNGAKRTKGRGPFQVAFQLENISNRSIAQQIEMKIKKLTRVNKEKLIAGDLCLLKKLKSYMNEPFK